MTPAVEAARAARIHFELHEYAHDPANTQYGLEAADALGVDPLRVFKTLLVRLNGDPRRLAVGIVPVTGQLDLKVFANVCGAKRAEMADPAEAQRATGYLVGGISPLGQKKRLPTVLDETAGAFDTVFVSGGRRVLDIELAPGDLLDLCTGRLAPIAR